MHGPYLLQPSTPSCAAGNDQENLKNVNDKEEAFLLLGEALMRLPPGSNMPGEGGKYVTPHEITKEMHRIDQRNPCAVLDDRSNTYIAHDRISQSALKHDSFSLNVIETLHSVS